MMLIASAPSVSTMRSFMVSINASRPTRGSPLSSAKFLHVGVQQRVGGKFIDLPDDAQGQREAKGENNHKKRTQVHGDAVGLIQKIDDEKPSAPSMEPLKVCRIVSQAAHCSKRPVTSPK